MGSDDIELRGTSCRHSSDSYWIGPEPAEADVVMGKLKHPSRFGDKVAIGLLYPGSGLDFKSFWTAADPDWIIMMDPGLATVDSNPTLVFQFIHSHIVRQLSDAQFLANEIIIFDTNLKTAEPLEENSLSTFEFRKFNTQSTFRIAFVESFNYKGKKRLLVFIVAWYEDLSLISSIPKSKKCKIYGGIPSSAHIVYEHKSMIGTTSLRQGVAPGGGLIWGLPDDAKTIEWSLQKSEF